MENSALGVGGHQLERPFTSYVGLLILKKLQETSIQITVSKSEIVSKHGIIEMMTHFLVKLFYIIYKLIQE